ncbi:energy-coupling factor transporter transmembrane component T [Mobilicoccus massiliensis]|uniref:energy-coupling factor transporter transmembrane component T n=1 Tax=Mobilicoccus massiliensis TaxID=1522310 RepID=UPI00069344D9|nr:energy-coupling factor transporter transmembrane component T [Mobilicoccus massiliensis]
MRRSPSLARSLHPVAWWVWAIGLAVAASRATEVLTLVAVGGVVAWVVVERHEPGGLRILFAFLGIGAVTFVVRLTMTALFGGGIVDGPVVLSLPELRLPAWAGRLRLGGDVTLGALTSSVLEALRLAVMLLCLGGANALAGPRRLLRHVPATLYDVGTALVVALSYAPELVDDASRVRAARMLRGHSGRGVRELGTMALPVVAGALERSLHLAASMESRGYGRAGHRGVRRQRRATAVGLVGVVGVLVGVYGLLDAATPFLLAAPLVVAGLVLAAGALLVGGSADRRTRYRHDPWSWPETIVTALGIGPAVVVVVLSATRTPTTVLAPTATSALTVAVVLTAGLAGVVAPPRPEHRTRPRTDRVDLPVGRAA